MIDLQMLNGTIQTQHQGQQPGQQQQQMFSSLPPYGIQPKEEPRPQPIIQKIKSGKWNIKNVKNVKNVDKRWKKGKKIKKSEKRVKLCNRVKYDRALSFAVWCILMISKLFSTRVHDYWRTFAVSATRVLFLISQILHVQDDSSEVRTGQIVTN